MRELDSSNRENLWLLDRALAQHYQLVPPGRNLSWICSIAIGAVACRKSDQVEPIAHSEADAFAATYLEAGRAQTPERGQACRDCHARGDVLDKETTSFLEKRWKSGRSAWALSANLQSRCGTCHRVPEPATLPSGSWPEVFARMDGAMKSRNLPAYSMLEWQDLRHFYLTYSLAHYPTLPPDPPLDTQTFHQQAFGNPIQSGEQPWVCHLKTTDLDADGQLDFLVCDTSGSSVNWIRRVAGAWKETKLANVPFPDHAEPFTNAATGRIDIVVACQTKMAPTDAPIGSVMLLRNDGEMRFTTTTILDRISRVADVRPVDLDGDGDPEFLVAAYGFVTSGEIGWLDQTAAGYAYHSIVKRSGAVNVLPTDLNGDGRADFIALFAQEHETVSAFLNQGNGRFEEKVLFQAATPSYGSSGISLVDLDRDDDLDLLYTNGDNMDLSTMVPRPFHGIQWLENEGNLQFKWYNIRRFYGAYSAVAGDLNGDGHTDLVVSSMFNDWKDSTRASLMWLENDGHQKFTAHTIAHDPIQLVTTTLADTDGDGTLDILAGAMNIFPNYPRSRQGRITLWKNSHQKPNQNH